MLKKIILGIIITTMFLLVPASAWLSGYDYRMPIYINNTASVNLTNYQYNFTLNTASLVATGKMNVDGSDCRITNSTDHLLPIWNETQFNSSATKIWVNAISIGNTSNETHYMYYGNVNADTVVNGYTTFPFFDDFEIVEGWNKNASNPILDSYGAGPRFDDGFVYNPQVIKNGTNDYLMYYIGVYQTGGIPKRDNIGLATSTDLINWVRYNGSDTDNSILYSGGAGDFDYDRAWLGYVIRENATSWKMWYGGDSDAGADHACSIGYATSTDGYNWTKFVGDVSGGAIFNDLDGGPAYPGGATEPVVLKESETDYKMWYHPYPAGGIKYANSTNGLNWTIQNNDTAVITTEWTPLGVEKIDETYYLWTHIKYDEIRVFTSTNCINWEPHGTQLTTSSGAWDSNSVYYGRTFKYSDTEWYLFYTGGNGTNLSIGVANLTDTIPIVDSNISWNQQASTAISTTQVKNGTYSMKLDDTTTPSGSGRLDTTFNFQEGVLDYDFYRTPSATVNTVLELLDSTTVVFSQIISTWAPTESIYHRTGAGWINYSNGGATATGNTWESYSIIFKESTSAMKATVNNTYLGTGDKWNAGTIDIISFDSGTGSGVGTIGYLDNIRLRGYALIEPITSLGAEEGLPVSNIVIIANSWGMFNNWTAATTFSAVASNESNDVTYSYYNVTSGLWESYYIGYSWNANNPIGADNSVMGFFDSETTIAATIVTPSSTELYTGWNMLFVQDTDNETITSIIANIGANCTDVWWFNSSAGTYSNTSSDTIQPNQGFLAYLTQNMTWTRSDL